MVGAVTECGKCGALIFYAHADGELTRLDLVATGPFGQATKSGAFTVDFSTSPPALQAPRDSDLERGKSRFRRHECPSDAPADNRKVARI